MRTGTALARCAGSKRGQLFYARFERKEKLGQRPALTVEIVAGGVEHQPHQSRA